MIILKNENKNKNEGFLMKFVLLFLILVTPNLFANEECSQKPESTMTPLQVKVNILSEESDLEILFRGTDSFSSSTGPFQMNWRYDLSYLLSTASEEDISQILKVIEEDVKKRCTCFFQIDFNSGLESDLSTHYTFENKKSTYRKTGEYVGFLNYLNEHEVFQAYRCHNFVQGSLK
jgi:hypothetical protein